MNRGACFRGNALAEIRAVQDDLCAASGCTVFWGHVRDARRRIAESALGLAAAGVDAQLPRNVNRHMQALASARGRRDKRRDVRVIGDSCCCASNSAALHRSVRPEIAAEDRDGIAAVGVRRGVDERRDRWRLIRKCRSHERNLTGYGNGGAVGFAFAVGHCCTHLVV